MPQLVLPIFPPECKHINNQVGVEKINGRVYYIHGLLPVFSHDENDQELFRFITSQLVINGNVKQKEIVRAFGISAISVKRYVKRFRKHGAKGFFRQPKARSAHVLTEEVKKKVQKLLDKGQTASEIGQKLHIKPSTIRKAIQSGRIEKKRKDGEPQPPLEPSSNKSERNVIDSQASMGLGCTREQERVDAALGELNGVKPVFAPSQDVKSAGVLFCLPALLLNGLLKYTDKCIAIPKGYYGLESFLLLLAFAVLLRIKSVEAIRRWDTGEFGKTIGLDRIPEVKTLRKKIEHIANHADPSRWSKELSKYWMEEDTDMAGTLYVDGHVRVYNGSKTSLPKRYVSRQKLCLRGLTDYWVNDAVGRPFFVVTRAINAGLLSVLRGEIIPQLLKDIPQQPTKEELEANRNLYRFGVVFDREGYSPKFFKEMWDKRIACYTYKKYADDTWPESEFFETEVTLPNGEVVTMKLAERGVSYKREKLWVREIRKLNESKHQTALITTDFVNEAKVVAGKMFARWSQENFLKYMMEHFGIDRLIEYKQEEIDETATVVNPIGVKLRGGGTIPAILCCLYGLCRPYGAKTIGVSFYPPLTQWATVVTPRWGVFVLPRRGATQ